jgi:hypothetical protein
LTSSLFRVIKRPFDADGYLQEMMKETLLSKNSIIQRVWNSQIFSQWLSKLIEGHGGPAGSAARNLSAAKHRFESYAKPLCRMLLNFDCVVETAQMIVKRRTGAESKDADRWLASITEEKMLQLAMVADATDEGLLLTRAMDSEDMDLATLHSDISRFVDRITLLFDKGQCMDLQPGFTAHMRSLLQHERVILLSSGETRIFGGKGAVTPDVTARCLARMRSFTTLAREVVQAEFPDFELFAAFQVFDLADGGTGSKEPSSHEGGNFAVRRLAQVFKVDEAALAAQIKAHRPIALSTKSAGHGFDNKTAWQATVQKTQKHGGTRAAYPVDALMPVLTRYLSFCASTSGVEQSFSAGLRALEPSRLNMQEDCEEATLRFATLKWRRTEAQCELPSSLVQRAREIWVESGFGQSRQHTAQRIDAGVKGCHHRDEGEHAWLKAKRRAVTNAVAASPSGVTVEAADPDSGAWTTRHHKEQEKQRKKQALRRVEALRDGVLLPEEISPDLVEAAAKEAKKDQQRDKAHRNGAKRRAFRIKSGKRLKMPAGTVVWVDPEAQEKVQEAVAEMEFVIAQDKSLDVQLYVLPTLADWKSHTRILMYAALSGAAVAPAQTVADGKGPYLQLKGRLQLRRAVWATPDFTQKHPAVVKVLQEAAGRPGSKWTCYASKAEFEQHVRAKPRDVALALTRGGEALELPRRVLFVTKHAFLTSLVSVDHRATNTA